MAYQCLLKNELLGAGIEDLKVNLANGLTSVSVYAYTCNLSSPASFLGEKRLDIYAKQQSAVFSVGLDCINFKKRKCFLVYV